MVGELIRGRNAPDLISSENFIFLPVHPPLLLTTSHHTTQLPYLLRNTKWPTQTKRPPTYRATPRRLSTPISPMRRRTFACSTTSPCQST